MALLKKLSSLFKAPDADQNDTFNPLVVRCSRCGEVVRTQVSLSNDLSVDYGENGEIAAYVCRKVLVGKQRCFQPIEVRLTFDAQRRLVDRQIVGGEFVDDMH